MRIIDWSSDVCASELFQAHGEGDRLAGVEVRQRRRVELDALAGGERPADAKVGQRRLLQLRQQGGHARLHLAQVADVGEAATADLGRLAHEVAVGRRADADGEQARSEEHTSALQSPMRTSYAGFCLKITTQKEAT